MKKTVIVLGAGFSAPAGMPLQADLMRGAVYRDSQPFQETIRATYSTLFDMRQPEQMEKAPLEDVFTMLDRARRTGETIGGLSHEQIRRSQVALLTSIAHDFNKALLDCETEMYVSFFRHLIARVYRQDDADNCLSLITLNWDTIPDFAIAAQNDEDALSIDYGFRTCSLSGDSENEAPRERSPARRISLFKLHGSIDWLICSCCRRVFKKNSYGDVPPVAIPFLDKCRYCKNAELESSIITPTLLKDFYQPHFQQIWHGALLALQAATEIVFIGYSLPLADFEFRYLLLKSITGKSAVRIRATLYPPDDRVNSPADLVERENVKSRYKNLFAGNAIDFICMDAAKFMSQPTLISSL